MLAIIFWQFTVFLYSFGTPQVKRTLISDVKESVYEFVYELLNDLLAS